MRQLTIEQKADALKDPIINNGRSELSFIDVKNNLRTMENNQKTQDPAMSQGPSDFLRKLYALPEKADRRGYSYNDSTLIPTTDAIDVSLQGLTKSIIGVMAIEKAMSDLQCIVTYQDLLATNSVNGIVAGDNAYGNFSPPNSKVDGSARVIKQDIEADGNTVFPFNVISENLLITLVKKDDAAVKATSVQKDGNFYFERLNAVTPPTVTFDKVKKTLTVANLGADYKIVSEAGTDAASSSGAQAPLNVEAIIRTQTLVAQQQVFTLTENILGINAQTKLAMVQGGRGNIIQDMSSLAFSRMSELYIQYLNRVVVKGITDAADKNVANVDDDLVLDLSGYIKSIGNATNALGSASSKNDRFSHALVDMGNDYLSKIGVYPTYMVIGTTGSSEIQILKDFSAVNTRQLNGVIGTYGINNLSVIRHQIVTAKDLAATVGNQKYFYIYLGFKDPDNQSAAAVFGEFIPPFFATAQSYENPNNRRSSMASMTAFTVIEDSLVRRYKVRVL